MTNSKEIPVQDYNIYLGDSKDAIARFLDRHPPSKVIVLMDDNTAVHCLPILKDIAVDGVIRIPAGEKFKNLETAQSIWDQLFSFKTDRNSLLINLGGGVIGDMGGFCASTYMRGMRFIQVPTTLLSQVDASIGGKLGIDYHGLKNSVGLFKNPEAVFVDTEYLDTLPYVELRSGFAEIIKHGLIADENLWQDAQDCGDLKSVSWQKIVEDSILVKKDVVDSDPFERGRRKILNFGHTIGHGVESVMLESAHPLLHGEAVAIGMIAESYISKQKEMISGEDLKAIGNYLIGLYGSPTLHEGQYDDFIIKMRHDKKNRGDEINFTLLESIGKARENCQADTQLIKESIDYYNSLS